MMKRGMGVVLLSALISLAVACSEEGMAGNGGTIDPVVSNYNGTSFIAGYAVAKDAVLRRIPVEWINKARTNLHIAYQHTSHGTHVSRGLFGLPGFKGGDDVLFGLCTPSTLDTNKLEFDDNPMSGDLSQDPEDMFVQETRAFLDNLDNGRINVVMWSWCDIAGHDVAGNYLPGMATLISEYGAGGSTARAATNPVHFIFMTGHANKNANTGDGNPKNQAALITNYCGTNGLFCLDYYSIDTHDMDDNYWEDAGDDGDSATGGDFYQVFQDAGTIGADWYNNLDGIGGDEVYGAHNTQHITANRKAFAMWWILARLAGWDGTLNP